MELMMTNVTAEQKTTSITNTIQQFGKKLYAYPLLYQYKISTLKQLVIILKINCFQPILLLALLILI